MSQRACYTLAVDTGLLATALRLPPLSVQAGQGLDEGNLQPWAQPWPPGQYLQVPGKACQAGAQLPCGALKAGLMPPQGHHGTLLGRGYHGTQLPSGGHLAGWHCRSEVTVWQAQAKLPLLLRCPVAFPPLHTCLQLVLQLRLHLMPWGAPPAAHLTLRLPDLKPVAGHALAPSLVGGRGKLAYKPFRRAGRVWPLQVQIKTKKALTPGTTVDGASPTV